MNFIKTENSVLLPSIIIIFLNHEFIQKILAQEQQTIDEVDSEEQILGPEYDHFYDGPGREINPLEPAVRYPSILKGGLRHLDLRIGKVLDVRDHPDRNALYILEVDFGESKPRYAVTGVKSFRVYPYQLKDQCIVFLANVRSAIIQDTLSQAVAFFAANYIGTDMIYGPIGSLPGDTVEAQKFPPRPLFEINLKSKLYRNIKKSFYVDKFRYFMYKGEILNAYRMINGTKTVIGAVGTRWLVHGKIPF